MNKLTAAVIKTADMTDTEWRVWRVAYWLWPDDEQKRRDYFDMRIRQIMEVKENGNISRTD